MEANVKKRLISIKNNRISLRNTYQPILTTLAGKVKGRLEKNVFSFKGIPFAAPPIGNLRFRPPQPVTPWDTVLDCTEPSDAALQKSILPAVVIHQEDCLRLNLWTPETMSDKSMLPVLVFIHGGGFAKGSPGKRMYEGIRFAQNGVVMVSIAYRLNALGFLSFAETEQENNALGNLGLLDQIAALQWVQNNIAFFGGDPSQVTICGESAGAFSVSSLMVSPLAKGLFIRAILESGNLLGQPIISPNANGSRAQAIEVSKEYCTSLGAANFSEMQNIDSKEIVKYCPFRYDMTHPSLYNFWPVFDGKVIPENPYQALLAGNINQVDILAGYNTDEGTIFIPEGISEETYIQMLMNIFGKNAGKVLLRFPVDSEHTPTMRARMLIEMGFRFGNDVFAKELTKQGHHAYLYNFDYTFHILNTMGLGSMHALELVFVFDTLPDIMLKDPSLAAFANTVHTYWLNFVKYGNPNTGIPVSAPWPCCTTKQNNFLVLNQTPASIKAPLEEDVDFYLDILWKQQNV